MAETFEELNILEKFICGLRANILQQAEVWASTNTKEAEKSHSFILCEIYLKENINGIYEKKYRDQEKDICTRPFSKRSK